jgi:type IV secretory pathway VirB3-like protein
MATDLNIDPLFHGITGFFSIFDGVTTGVATQSNNIGQILSIVIILGALLSVISLIVLIFARGASAIGLGGRRI